MSSISTFISFFFILFLSRNFLFSVISTAITCNIMPSLESDAMFCITEWAIVIIFRLIVWFTATTEFKKIFFLSLFYRFFSSKILELISFLHSLILLIRMSPSLSSFFKKFSHTFQEKYLNIFLCPLVNQTWYQTRKSTISLRCCFPNWWVYSPIKLFNVSILILIISWRLFMLLSKKKLICSRNKPIHDKTCSNSHNFFSSLLLTQYCRRVSIL